jgi:c-di-GMP-binding flagellar brake protein YcgR
LAHAELLRRGTLVTLETVSGDRWLRQTFVVEKVSADRLELCAFGLRLVGSLPAPGSRVLCFIATPVRVYQFESTVLASAEKPEPTVALELPKVIVPFQRRQFFRLQVLHTVTLADPEGQWQIEATGVDVGAGGVGVRIRMRGKEPPPPLPTHSRLNLTIHLPPAEEEFPQGLQVTAVGEVVWRRRDEQGWRVGIAFVDIDRKVQERLIAWCCAFQRRLLRLGLFSTKRGVISE